ncbi:hypothetical protein D9M68_792230 [compost metagenome]
MGEQAAKLQRDVGRAVRITLDQRLPHRPGLRAREHQQTAVEFFQPFALDQRPAPAVAARPGARQQLAQVQIALFVLHQQDHARRGRLVAAGHGARGFVGEALQHHLGAQQGLDARAARGLVELDRTKQVAQVGDGQGGLAVGRRRGHHVVDAVGAVNDGKFGVQAQMDEHLSIMPSSFRLTSPGGPSEGHPPSGTLGSNG